MKKLLPYLPSLLSWIGYGGVLLYGAHNENVTGGFCKEMGAPAVVLAGFSVAAFNLRFRMMDALQKLDLKKSQIDHLEVVFKECRSNIDRCILIFVMTTVVLVTAKFAENAAPLQRLILLSAGTGLFIQSFVEFIRILIAMRRLEDFMLSQLKSSAKYL